MQNTSARPSKILSLPEDVATQISSSTAIPSLTSVVIGLLENSLDAGATEIEIRVDFRRASCDVEDDGDGIVNEEFAEEGGLGKRFYTSKYKSLGDPYGGHGTFLSSVAALSILLITSRRYDRSSQRTLILHHARPAARLSDSQSHDVPLVYGHGTRVIVRDLFGNMPVRVKQRNTSAPDCAQHESKEFEHLKRSITAVLLSFHKPVHVLFCQDEREGPIKKTHIGVRPDRNLATGNESSDSSIKVPLLCKLLTHSGYIDPSEWDTWIKVSARSLSIAIRGVISLQPAPSKHVQFMSLGKRPLDQENGHNILYEEVNRLFALSSFGIEEDSLDRTDVGTSKDGRYKSNGFTRKQLKGQGKGVDRWPMFYIRVELGEQNDPRKLERESTLNGVLKVLGAMVHAFLENNHLRPRPLTHRSRNSATPLRKLPSLQRALQAGDAFSNWSRIKSSHQTEASTLTHPQANVPKPRQASANSIATHETADEIEAESAGLVNAVGESLVEWINPITRNTVLINSRTGLAVPRPSQERRPATAPGQLQRPHASLRLVRPTPRRFTTPPKGSWADDLLSKWENPVFALPTEDPIPQASFDNPLPDVFPMHNDNIADVGRDKASVGSASSTLSTSLSTASLESAHVIAQVDKKFILLSVGTTTTSSLLVLVDQHAADERIRVEALLDDLQTQGSVPVNRPLTFDIPSKEHSLFTAHAPFFARWGITYTLLPGSRHQLSGTVPIATPTTRSSSSRLTILTLPPTIATRCQTDPKILLTFLRTGVWSLDANPSHSSPSFSSSSYSKSAPPPPQGLRDMLASRACRSSIMFNDVLSLDEAKVLVAKLASTQRPWVCAHGRPSMVPIVDIGSAATAINGSVNAGTSEALASGLHGIGRRQEGRNGNDDDDGDDDGDGSYIPSFRNAWMKWEEKGGR